MDDGTEHVPELSRHVGTTVTYHDNVIGGQARVHFGDHHGDIYYWNTPAPRHRDDKSDEEALLKAAEHGQVDLLKKILAKPGIDVDYQGPPDASTALHRAAQHGQTKAAKLLVKAGCKLDIQCFDLGTPLCEAAYKGNVKIVKILIAAGANQEAFCCLKGSALHAACLAGHTSIVEILLRAGADPTTEAAVVYSDATTEVKTGAGTKRYFIRLEGQPMWIAIYRGHAEIIKLLASFKASGNISGRYQRSNERTETLDGAFFKPGEARTAVFTAMAHPNADVLEEVLRAGGDVETGDSELNRVPLEHAVATDKLEHVRALLNHDANPNGFLVWGLRPLCLAIKAGNIEIARLLVTHDAELDFEDYYQDMLEEREITAEMYQLLADAREWTLIGNVE